MLGGMERHAELGSTNDRARELARAGAEHGYLVWADRQTAGRGRKGAEWWCAPGRGLAFSVVVRPRWERARWGWLSLAAGLGVAEALEGFGFRPAIKWPNDLLWKGRKIAGILLEVNGETDGPASATIGIGVNLDLESDLQQQIGQPYASLRDAGVVVDRNRLAADLLEASVSMCRRFTDAGLTPFLDTWRRYDVLQGRSVRLVGPNHELKGNSLGLADDGGLRLQIGESISTYYSGELSLRAGKGP